MLEFTDINPYSVSRTILIIETPNDLALPVRFPESGNLMLFLFDFSSQIICFCEGFVYYFVELGSGTPKRVTSGKLYYQLSKLHVSN